MKELTAYQNAAYAAQYAEFVARVQAAEQAAMPGQTRYQRRVLYDATAYRCGLRTSL